MCKKEKDEHHGYCCFCLIDIKCDNGRKVQLLKHCTIKKHKEAIKHAKDRNHAKHTSFFASKPEGASCSTASQPKSVGLFTISDATLEAGIYWPAYSNYSLHSSDHIGNLFQTMFADSKIAENFTLSCTSASYIIGQGLSPYLTQVIIDDVLEFKLPFSVHFDETIPKQVKKEMDLTVIYWSPRHEDIWTVFYTSLFFGHTEGEMVAAVMHSKMFEDGLPVERMATLVRDGPNVNKTIFQKMNELILQDHPEFLGLIDLGSAQFTLFTMHLAKG